MSDEEAAEPVSELLTAFGAVSVTFSDAAGQALYEPPPGSQPLWRQTRIDALFDAPVDLEKLRTRITAVLEAVPLRDWKVEILPDRVWEREWMTHYKPMRFGEHFWVCPSHEPPPDPAAVNLLLDPGLAFGTGTHPSTSLCLEWLGGADLYNLAVIDYGCGSGILAIAAVLLGAKTALAVDIDPQALTATAANAQNNSVADRIRCLRPDEIGKAQADLVIANILANVLAELEPVFTACVKPGGKLVLSGVLQDQAEQVLTAYRRNFNFAPPTVRENWVRLDGSRIS